MRVDLVTIFPEYFGPLSVSLLGRARTRGLVDIGVHDLRAWTGDVHRSVDDSPYGGGPGMVMRPEPWSAALTEITGRGPRPADGPGPALAAGEPGTAAPAGGPGPALPADGSGPATGAGPAGRPRVVVPTPSGRPFTQSLAAQLAAEPHLVFCCGRYEGIDARVVEAWADDEVSLGDYVLAGGEVAALVILEAVTRLLPGVVGNEASVADDSFAAGLLEGPVYTRPPTWAGREVPAVLRSGDHGAVARWQRDESLRRTALRRPDLLAGVVLSDRDREVVAAAAGGAPAAGVPAPDTQPGTVPGTGPAADMAQ